MRRTSPVFSLLSIAPFLLLLCGIGLTNAGCSGDGGDPTEEETVLTEGNPIDGIAPKVDETADLISGGASPAPDSSDEGQPYTNGQPVPLVDYFPEPAENFVCISVFGEDIYISPVFRNAEGVEAFNIYGQEKLDGDAFLKLSSATFNIGNEEIETDLYSMGAPLSNSGGYYWTIESVVPVSGGAGYYLAFGYTVLYQDKDLPYVFTEVDSSDGWKPKEIILTYGEAPQDETTEVCYNYIINNYGATKDAP